MMSTRCPTWPYLVSVPATAVVVALGSIGLGLGMPGIVAGATLGFVWSIGLGLAVSRFIHAQAWRRRLANGSIFLCILANGVMLGGGLMYVLMMRAAVDAPLAVLSAMMQPAIPFFIVLNTPLELLLVPGAMFANWHSERRRPLIVCGALSYYALRIWTYLVYVPARMEIASRSLTPSDVEWFQRSLSVDYRPLLVAVVLTAFTATAFRPETSSEADRSSNR